jgi:diguanylate cyclase (GGDEF)-like protein
MPPKPTRDRVFARDLVLIEDSGDDALLLSVLLEELPQAPFQVRRASCLADGIAMALAQKPDAVIVDLDLPDAMGLDVLVRLRAAVPTVPVVVLTGDDNEDLAVQAVRAGAQDYLVKGRVDSWILARSLRHALERHRLVRELEAAREREAHRATHDPLTGLPNRSLFFDRLAHALAQAERRRERIAVLYLDLDGFKPVNDNFGHTVGDQVLMQVAARLAEGVRRSDTLARLGGDEFGVVFERVPDRSMAESLVLGLKPVLRDPIIVEGYHCPIGFSAGLAVFPDDGRDADSLMRVANAAMYREKEARGQPQAQRRLRVI